ncbi:hypothetical protein NMY22_g9871 [Coprinellus aureogranulatus]|nr:hypothetical protein NMY22_g9871 [Coprinellus aureogranulatus]
MVSSTVPGHCIEKNGREHYYGWTAPFTMAPSTISKVNARPQKREHRFELVTFKVEDKLYRVPRHGFAWNSDVFKTMFSLPQALNSTEGRLDTDPIVLPACTKPEFDRELVRGAVSVPVSPAPGLILANVLLHFPAPILTKFGRHFPLTGALSKEEWISVLKLSTLWDMREIRAYAIEILSAMKMGIIERTSLAREYRVLPWLMDGYTTLITTWDTCGVSFEELTWGLGWETAARILSLAMKAKSRVWVSVSTWASRCTKNCQRRNPIVTVFDSSATPTEEVIRCTACQRDLGSAKVTKIECLEGAALEQAIKDLLIQEYDGMQGGHSYP